MNKETILQAEHDAITDCYDWLNNKETKEDGKIQYVLGVHDLVDVLLDKLDKTKGE